jgi:hypothetical protein
MAGPSAERECRALPMDGSAEATLDQQLGGRLGRRDDCSAQRHRSPAYRVHQPDAGCGSRYFPSEFEVRCLTDPIDLGSHRVWSISIYLDFGHDTSLESVITAMQLLPARYDGHVSVKDIDPNRAWQSALIAPMGGRLHVERLKCGGSGAYVRMVLNNAVVPLKPLLECASDAYAWAGLCKLDAFLASQTYALNGADFGNCAKSESCEAGPMAGAEKIFCQDYTGVSL